MLKEKNKKKEILDTAYQMFANYSYEGVSIQDIAKKLSISKAALYHYFSSKEEMVIEIMSQIRINIVKDIKRIDSDFNTIEDKIREIFRMNVEYSKQGSSFMSFLHQENFKNLDLLKAERFKLVESIHDSLKGIVAQLYKNEKKLDIKIATSLFIGILMSMSDCNDNKKNKKQDLDNLVNQFFVFINKK